MVLHPLLEHATLVLQERLGRLAVLRRKVVGVLGEPFAGEDVVQDHKHPKVLLSVDAEERGHPAQGLGAVRVALQESLELAHVVAGAVPGLVEGEVDYQLPALVGVLQRRIGQFADVTEQHSAVSLGVPPPELMELLELALALDAKLLVEHLPHATDAVALVVLAAGLLDDALGVHAGELHGDRGIDLLADADLAHAGRPGPAAGENLLGLAAGDRRADRAVVQGRQLLGVQAPQRLDLGHQRRQEQSLHQPVVVAEGRPPRVVVDQGLDFLAAAVLPL